MSLSRGHSLEIVFLVDVVEVVTQEDSVLLVISFTEVEELLVGAVEVGHVLEFLQVLLERNKGDKSGYFLNRKLTVLLVNSQIWRWDSRAQVSTQEDTLTINVFSPALDRSAFILFTSSEGYHPLTGISQ